MLESFEILCFTKALQNTMQASPARPWNDLELELPVSKQPLESQPWGSDPPSQARIFELSKVNVHCFARV